jgi:flavin reductase (DIM6/NTAB) family NADH-FMN oxidoreductase RutF
LYGDVEHKEPDTVGPNSPEVPTVPHCNVIIEPESAGFSNVYKVMGGSIVPRPIAFVSTVSTDGIYNLSPFSFFTGASANPPVICFCPMRNADGRKKDTLVNVEKTGDFVVNIVSEEFAGEMNTTSAEFPPDVDEFHVAGLTPVSSDLVKSLRVTGNTYVQTTDRFDLVRPTHL